MMAYYRAIRLSNNDNPSHLVYEDPAKPLSETALALKVAVDEAARRIASAFPKSRDRVFLFERLLDLASRGLAQSEAMTEEALRELDAFKNDVVDKATVIRNAYHREVVKKVFVPLVLDLIAVFVWMAVNTELRKFV
jgi:hypothetical protein